MKKSEFFFILGSFLIWRILLVLIQYFAFRFFPSGRDFLGGGLDNYLANPYLWSWANFDGEHYLAIAQFGYQPLTYFFFPSYPLLIHFFGNSVLSALAISHAAFLLALIGFYKIVKLDYPEKVARLSIILLLIFPTSFFFVSAYTESLFLAIVVWFFYFLRYKKWLEVVVLGSLASATRLIGSVLLTPLGLFAYMFYLFKSVGDPFAFVHNVSIFGSQRSFAVGGVLQVFYRYFFKVLPNLNYSYFPNVFVAYLELLVAIAFLAAIVLSFRKIRLEYWLFLLLGYLVPTFSGSFSSLPRYVLVLFPAFLYAAIALLNAPRFLRISIYILLLGCLIVSESLFVRGFWVS